GVRGDALVGPDRGHPAGARDGPRARDAAADPRRDGGRGRRLARRCGRADRVLRPRRQGPRAVRELDGGPRLVTAVMDAPVRTGTNDTRGARRIASAFKDAADAGRAALIPYVVAGYPDAETSYRAALIAVDAGAHLLELGLPYSDPLADGATLQKASGIALRNGATLEGSLRLIERIAAARPAIPVVPMGYANQFIGGGDGRESARRLSDAGAAGVIVADLTPDEGRPFEAVAREHDLAVVYLVAPTTPPDRRREIAARSGGFLYCVSLVGVTGARDALPPTVGRLVRDVVAA